MKIKFIVLGLTLIFNCHPIIAQNWFPLEVGNKWQYLDHDTYRLAIFEPVIHIYSLKTNSIIKDTSINQTQYYKWNRFPNIWIRFDSSSQKLYQWCDSTDLIIMDFAIDVDSVELLSPYSCNLKYCLIIEDNFSLGDSIYYAKGLNYFENIFSTCDYVEYYSLGVGQIHYGYGCSYHNGGSSSSSHSLLQANIGNSYYSYNYFPAININPITSVADSVFNLNVEVSHEYNHIFPDSTPHTSLNFIDTVKMQSYYSKGSAIIQNSAVYGENISGTDDWNIYTFLNMDLMMDDYKFYYRIEAIDKGMLPYSTIVPISGYFIAIWDTTTDVEKNNESVVEFKLFQNYPNPFNPTTTIKYQIPELSFVTIKIYDVLGNEIATLINEEKPVGNYEVKFSVGRDSSPDIASGIYFYRIQAGSFTETKKMILLR